MIVRHTGGSNGCIEVSFHIYSKMRKDHTLSGVYQAL